jgi:hypothetical protein
MVERDTNSTSATGEAKSIARPSREASMLLLSSVDIAIARAKQNGTLRLVPCHNERLDMDFVAVEDDHGVITVASDRAEAERMVAGDFAPAEFLGF